MTVARSFIALAAGMVGIGAAVAGPSKTPKAITPGMGIPEVRLGMARAEAIRALGKPQKTSTIRLGAASKLPATLQGAYTEDDWEPDGPTGSDHPTHTRIEALSRGGRIVQIAVAGTKYALGGNPPLSTASTFTQVRQQYRALHVLPYSTDDAVTMFFDDAARGIAFTTTTQDDMGTYEALPKLTPESIILHPRGQAVLPVNYQTPGVPTGPMPGEDGAALIQKWLSAGDRKPAPR